MDDAWLRQPGVLVCKIYQTASCRTLWHSWLILQTIGRMSANSKHQLLPPMNRNNVTFFSSSLLAQNFGHHRKMWSAFKLYIIICKLFDFLLRIVQEQKITSLVSRLFYLSVAPPMNARVPSGTYACNMCSVSVASLALFFFSPSKHRDLSCRQCPSSSCRRRTGARGRPGCC